MNMRNRLDGQYAGNADEQVNKLLDRAETDKPAPDDGDEA